VLVLPNGKILLAGFSGPEGGNIQVARLNAGGALDATFGSGGNATVDFGGDGRVTLSGGGSASAVLVQPDGKIVLAGNAGGNATMTVTRLAPNGSLDTTFDGDGGDATFGAAGKATIDFGVATFGNAVALQQNGRIVVAGQRTGGDDFALARLLG
jgi:uncharacterized delta-60 repeat protein